MTRCANKWEAVNELRCLLPQGHDGPCEGDLYEGWRAHAEPTTPREEP